MGGVPRAAYVSHTASAKRSGVVIASRGWHPPRRMKTLALDSGSSPIASALRPLAVAAKDTAGRRWNWPPGIGLREAPAPVRASLRPRWPRRAAG